MIERASEFTPLAAAPTPGSAAEMMSAGQLLRQAREAQNLHVEVVAAALKVPTQKLVALEEDNIDALPDPVFARALAASVCRALRVDPAPVLEKLPGAPRTALAESDRAISGSIRPHAYKSSARAGMVGRPSRLLLAVVGLLLVGALVLFLLPTTATQEIAATWSRWTAGSLPATEAGPDGTVVEPTQAISVPLPGSESPAEQLAAPDAAAASLPSAPAATPGSPEAAASPAPAAAAGSDLLVFNASAEVWIRVSDSNGKTVFERTLKAGETGSVSQAELPLAVVVGRASAVQVQLRGQAFDLNSLARAGGVARFEVQP